MRLSLFCSPPRSRMAASTSASPHTTLNGPQTRLERLIQTPAVMRQKMVSTTSPRKAPMTKSQSRSARESCFSALVVGSGRAAVGYARWIRFSTLAVIFCRSLSEPLPSSRFSCSSRGWRFAYRLTTTMAEIWSRTASAMPPHTTAWNSSGGRWAQSRNSRSLPQRTAAMPSRPHSREYCRQT